MTSANNASGDHVVERERTPNKVKFEIYGEEMIEKKVKSSGNSGRVYLPPNWVGHQVKIIRIDETITKTKERLRGRHTHQRTGHQRRGRDQ